MTRGSCYTWVMGLANRIMIGLAVGLCVGYASTFSGCTTFTRQPAIPDRNKLERDQLVIHSDFQVSRYHRMLDELTALRWDVSGKLDLTISDEPIHIYLFRTDRRYKEFMRHSFPELPQRRAFFIETDTGLNVYAHWGNHIAEDLRHEVVHGYLHSGVPNLPLWLDEGLAEYFEVPRGHQGCNASHIELLRDHMRQQTWQPDLNRLERLTMASEISLLDYAESWAWVHLFLETERSRKDFLQVYLKRLQAEGWSPAISTLLAEWEESPNERLLDHISSLRTHSVNLSSDQSVEDSLHVVGPTSHGSASAK